MKIANQTDSAMLLKEGGASGILFSIVFMLVGLGVGYSQHFSISPALWVAVAFFVVGLVMLLLASSITVKINKTDGQLAYQTQRLVGSKSTTFAIADVLRIETRKQWRMENVSSGNRGASMPRQVLMMQSVIVFKNGQELPLDHQKSSSSMSIGPAVLMGGSGAEVAIAKQVADFMGVPFQEIAPPNSGTGVHIGGGGGVSL